MRQTETAPVDAGPLAELLEARGFDIVVMPTLSVHPVEDQAELHAALRRLESYGWILFTSQNSVHAVLTEMGSLGLSIPASLKVAAVGPRTADALRAAGVEVACVPDEASGTALARALTDVGVRGSTILLPIGDKARSELSDALREGGAEVHIVTVYRTSISQVAPVASMELLREGSIAVVALASPSAFTGLLSMLGAEAPLLGGVRLVCIGPTTASAVRAAGFEPAAVAGSHTLVGLAEAIANLDMTGISDDRI